jgi:hypothetical protein
MAETRFYPINCRSMYCGETDADGAACLNCPNRPELDAFKEWRQRTKAVQPDPVWSPGAWRSPVLDL